MRKRVKQNPPREASDTDGFSTALVRGLQILRAFGPGDNSLGNLEIMERTTLPKATVSRLTYTLAGLGYLEYNEVLGRYQLGAAAVSLGYSALRSNAVVHVARPFMQKLADETGAAVALGARDQAEMVYLSNCRSESLVTLRLNAGSRVPLWKSGMGLAYLVGLTEDERLHLKDRFAWAEQADRARTEKLLDKALEEYSTFGYVTAFGTWHSYIRAVGVPFRPKDGSSPVAITCGGISDIIDEKSVIERVGPALVRLVAEVSATLGGDPMVESGHEPIR